VVIKNCNIQKQNCNIQKTYIWKYFVQLNVIAYSKLNVTRIDASLFAFARHIAAYFQYLGS
jgi:hypothetical protein